MEKKNDALRALNFQVKDIEPDSFYGFPKRIAYLLCLWWWIFEKKIQNLLVHVAELQHKFNVQSHKVSFLNI